MTHFFLFLAFCVAAVWGAVSLYRDHREYGKVRGEAAASERRLRDKERALAEQERAARRLVSDREYVELMIRRRLDYAKPEERVFRFDGQGQ
ncbi:MAG: septum formation initiator family protein [Opitutaceae bacterium]|nr:septum formation initiator family protein [Opitutaceae bacterium]